jgi:predicted dehydrogenase
MLKIAIVGCGKIADSHAQQIQRINGCEISAVCDREELMARQLQERFLAKRWFKDLNLMLSETHPDVVHITTPPQSHLSIAMQCLEFGCNVYVEKPFTINFGEAKKLLENAEKRRLKVTVGHDDQFRHAARVMRKMVQGGFLGGSPVHMESYYGYELGGSGYANALIGDKQHWVRALPGGLMHNIISHGIARISEYLTGENPRVIAFGFASPMLARMGETQIKDELRTIISDENGTTAYFTFSSQMRPSLHQFRIFGSKNGFQLDQDNETLIRLSGVRHKSFLEQFIPPVVIANQYLENLKRNVRLFLANDFHPKAGMKHLIELFYQSVLENAPLPIPYREILLTARIMDSIFEQINDDRRPLVGPQAGMHKLLSEVPQCLQN